MQRRTLTAKEVAEYLGVCKETIYTMVREKEIPHFKVRSRIFFSRESIDQWISQTELQSVDQNSAV
ncbi:DNA-binding protein [Heyndrickxia ginsengihumi]|uniref:DNA-binding protein n=1 Tax=Heyndrickxia ginsengihumi TaxID=363870 RepID=A0A0A6VDM2_9BACI|nr:helix-turn-helix domain-containing protein [Heyndrickxia ginsengihumi]KHD86345.1 DNA-binding protein [Heyndrickxia ginsengihumi]